MTDTVTCEFCGETFAEGSTDLPFHWWCDHLAELTDEQHRAAWVEHKTRLIGSIDVDVPVAIPCDTWEDVVKANTDDADPEAVSPADISKDALFELVEPEFQFRVAGREFDRGSQCGREGLRRDDECDFRPEVHIDVPRRTFERVLERARVEESVDDITPYEHGDEPDEIAAQLVEFYLPEYVWHVKDDED
jgi:hypothetical protein